MRRPITGLCLLAATAAGFAAPGGAAVTMRGPAEAQTWPAGTDLVPFEFRDGQIMVRTTLRSPSGRDTTGILMFDTGAPVLHLTLGTWNALNVDTLEVSMGYAQRIRRNLAALEMGTARVRDIPVGGVVVDSIFEPGVLGLFAPSVYEDHAVVIDYASRRLAIVNRRLTVVGGGAAAPAASQNRAVGVQARIGRSKAQYDEVLAAAAVPVPFRRYKGGRMLVTARVADPAHAWRSQPLTLLIDSGASACVVFADAMAERVRPPSRWSRQRDVTLTTVLGRFQEDALLLPRLQLTDASPAVEQDMIATCVSSRASLPDLQGELPDPIHGLLGNAFLARFRVVLDYGNDVLWLEGRPLPSAPPLTGHHVGLRVVRQWGELRIAAVQPGSSAAAAGIREGDVLIAIDHARLNDLDGEAVEQRLQGKPGTQVPVSVRRDGMERVYTLARTSRP